MICGRSLFALVLLVLVGLAAASRSAPVVAQDADATQAEAPADAGAAESQDADSADAEKKEEPEAFLIPRQAGIDHVIQGDYVGEVFLGPDPTKHAVQIIALGDGKFSAKLYVGGLPGEGWDGKKPDEFEGTVDGEFGIFKCSLGTLTVKNAGIAVENANAVVIGELIREIRRSKTQGMKPPKGAQVLLDSSDPLLTEESLPNWVSVKEGEEPQLDDVAICQGVNSKATFQDCILHIEFMTPFMPKARGQARGNSGVYLQGRYEVQVLDSFGLEGKDNECGGIYEVQAPKVNMCYPPLQWQTYDIKFTAAKFDASGKKTANARMTVYHNGVKIHDNVEVPKATRAAPNAEGPESGFLHLQDHGSPVRYRNIWVLDLVKARAERKAAGK
ncbi:MAG: DUF1080 domain-containing protein [Planctomycetota bacterium]|nr:MAG: DUF1080 domain-containing protein [Planctomycetota bacterium]